MHTNIKNGFFAWHGTSEAGIAPISEAGWDTDRRARQVYGSGEYFGTNPAISHGYCSGTFKLIVAYILKSN